MSALDFLLPWDSQPQEVAGVDWGNPLARKLLSQVGPGIYDPVTGGLCSLTGGPSISATSMGRALTFDGTTQYASWKYPYSGAPGAFSAAGWIKTTTTNNRAFCGRYETTTNNRSWFMGVAHTSWIGAPAGNEFSVIISADGGVSNIKAYYTTGVSVADDQWHHVAFTFAGGTLLLYVDGVARSTTKNSDVAITTIYGGTADLSLGAINPSTGGASFSNGSNLGFSVFERHLFGAEIAELRSNTWKLFAPRSIPVPVSAGGGTATDLTIQEAAHAHVADNLGLTVTTGLTVADATHAHSADNLAFTLDTFLAVADALHAQTADNLTLTTGGANLAVDEAMHAQAADNLALTLDTFLAVQDATHPHAADNLALTLDVFLTVADALHAHAADNLTLTIGGIGLVIAEALHAHAADNLAFTLDTFLAVADALHAQTADNLALSLGGALSDAEFRQMYDWLQDLYGRQLLTVGTFLALK